MDIENSDSEEIDATQLDMAAAVQAALFQDVALKGPEWFKAAVQQKAAEAKSAPGAIGFEMTSPSVKREEDKKRRDRETNDLANAYQQLQQQQQEREAWQRTPSTVGGVTMNGTEWAVLADRLKSDEDLRDRILAAHMARGMNEREAEARLERVRQVAEIAAIPPSQRTDEQKETLEIAEADKSFKKDMATAKAESERDTTAPKSDLSSSFDRAASGVPQTAKVAAPQVSGPVFDPGLAP